MAKILHMSTRSVYESLATIMSINLDLISQICGLEDVEIGHDKLFADVTPSIETFDKIVNPVTIPVTRTKVDCELPTKVK